MFVRECLLMDLIATVFSSSYEGQREIDTWKFVYYFPRLLTFLCVCKPLEPFIKAIQKGIIREVLP
jgi:hypothetical protein